MKPQINLYFIFILAITLMAHWSLAAANEDLDEETMSFESIVRDLSSSRSSWMSEMNVIDPFDLVRIHFGIGFVSSYINYESRRGPVSGIHQGFQASLGIDLFSKNWIAEGTVRSFGEEQIQQTRSRLHEFDLKIMYAFSSHTLLEPFMGIGVAARYLDVTENDNTSKFTSPASIFLLGSALRLSDGISIAGELSYRRPLIDETAERSAVDMALRLNTNF